MKNKYKILICVVSCLLIINANSLQSQQHVVKQPFDPSVIPQTPERGQFPVLMDNLSVNHFTGQPNIEIPLYTVDAYDIQVPIALKYRTGGLRVDVEEGYLGTNWDLIAGGEIRRTLVGLPDNFNNSDVKGYPYINGYISSYQDQDRKSFINALKNENNVFAPFSLNCDIVKLSQIYGPQHSDGRFDTGPDIYTFNIMGLNGTFTTGIAGHIENLQTNEWVNVISEGVDGFKITDSKGYIYIFKEKEWHKYKYRTGYYGDFIEWNEKAIQKFDYVISWKLSEIKSPTGETVYFKYNEHSNTDKLMEKSIYDVRSAYSNLYIPKKCHHESDEIVTISQYPLFSDFRAENKENYTYKYLTSITSTNAILKFNYILRYEESIPKLSTIAVYAGNDDEKILKKFELNNLSYYLYNISSIKEYGSGDTFKEYKISYYSDLPFSRFSVGKKDHWGYYSPNAQEYCSGMYHFDINTVLKFKENPSFFGHRNPKSDNPNEGMLHQITYPTGGKISFDWEFHDYSKRSTLLQQSEMTDGYFNDHEVMIMGIQPVAQKVTEELNQNNTSVEIYADASNKSVTIDLVNYYPASGTLIHDDCNLDGTTFCKCVLGWDGNSAHYPNEIPYVNITGPNNYSKKIYIIKSNVWKEHNVTLGSKGPYKYELVNAGKELIKNTTYCYEFYTYIMTSSSYGRVVISLENTPPPPEFDNRRENTFQAGGVRIKEIAFEGVGNQIRKLYNYSLDPYNVKSQSSGVLTKAPRYGSYLSVSTPTSTCSDLMMVEQFNHIYTLSVNAIPKSTEASGHIEYSHVTEFITSRSVDIMNNILDSVGSTKATMYEFWTSADGYDTSDINETLNTRHVPNNQLILTSMHFNRGHLKQKKEYTNEEKTTSYVYSILEKRYVDFIPGTLFTIRDFSTSNACYRYAERCNNPLMNNLCWYKDYGIVRYKIIPYNKRLQSVSVEGEESDDYHSYTYANHSYSDARTANEPLSHSTINSEGDTVTQHFTYISANLNRIHTCVTVKKGKIVDAYRNEYDTQGRIIEKYIAPLNPEGLPSANNYNAETLTNKLVESYLYNKNRLVQLTDHNRDISTVYLWSYNGAYPVAEIQNATFDDICNMLGNSAVENLYRTFTPDIDLLNGLRTGLQGSLVSTMTYKVLTGITSLTDPKGTTTYFNYTDLGKLKECYIIENGKKKIIQNMEYHWTHQ